MLSDEATHALIEMLARNVSCVEVERVMMHVHKTGREDCDDSQFLAGGQLQFRNGNQRKDENVNVEDKTSSSRRYGQAEDVGVTIIHQAFLPGLPGVWSLVVDSGYRDGDVEPPVDKEAEVATPAEPAKGTKHL